MKRRNDAMPQSQPRPTWPRAPHRRRHLPSPLLPRTGTSSASQCLGSSACLRVCQAAAVRGAPDDCDCLLSGPETPHHYQPVCVDEADFRHLAAAIDEQGSVRQSLMRFSVSRLQSSVSRSLSCGSYHRGSRVFETPFGLAANCFTLFAATRPTWPGWPP